MYQQGVNRMIKIVGICGSPRKGGNTEQILAYCLNRAGELGPETKLITLCDKNIRGCIACMKCRETKDGKCYGRDDDLNAIAGEVYSADGLIIASPVYFSTPTPEILAVLHRIGYVSRGNGGLLRGKAGAAIAVARHAGQNFTLAAMSFFFYINEMVQPGSTYWNVAFGRDKGDVMKDAEALDTVKRTAENMVELIKKIKGNS
jgi:multimeric flavodoxin WrbA